MDVSPLTDDSSSLLQQLNQNKSKLSCIPIGLTQGQFSLSAFKIQEDLKWFQMRSACLIAFCYTYLQNPLNWTSATINTIVIYGAKLVKDNYIHATESGVVNCTVNVENHIAKIQIEEPKIVDAVASIFTNLQNFFAVHQYGLFRCSNLCYLIWKTNGIFFLFDAQGRGNNGSLDDKYGFASLVCTELLKDVSKLIKSLSSAKLDECYTISPMTMMHFGKGLCEYVKPRIQYSGTETYAVVNDSFAILCGKIHIGHYGFQMFRNIQAMPVGLMALIYNEVQPSNSWTGEIVDKLILLGTKLFHECKKTPQGDITVRQLPREYFIIDYKCQIDYEPYVHTGQDSYSADEMKKNLLMYLDRAFHSDPQTPSVLIQINIMVFACWQNNGYYYLLDPYARNEEGIISDDKLGTPCVQMHCSLESLCSILCTNLNVIAPNDRFVLHRVNVTLKCKCGENVAANDLELLKTFMDELFWMEMNNFQEMSARSEEICNLNNESSDDDIFMEVIVGQNRQADSCDSLQSGSTNSHSSTSISGTSDTTESSKDDDSNIESNEVVVTQTIIDDSNVDVRKSNSVKMEKKDSARSSKKRKDGKDKDGKSKDAKGKDAKGKDAKGKDAKGKDAKGKDGEGKDGEGKDGEGKDGKGKDSKVKYGKDVKEKDGKEDDGKNKDGKGRYPEGEAKKSLVVIQSSSGTETSINKLLTTSFKISDRVLLVTEWGDFFVAHDKDSYILSDGCLCDYNALINMNLAESDTSERINAIEDVVDKVMLSNNIKSKSLTIKSKSLTKSNIKDLESPVDYSDLNTPFWELVEEMIELMKTTAKYDKIKNELV